MSDTRAVGAAASGAVTGAVTGVAATTSAGVSVADDLRGVVRLGVLRFEGVSVRATADDPAPEAGGPAGLEVSAEAEARVALVRAMYRRFGSTRRAPGHRPRRCGGGSAEACRGPGSTRWWTPATPARW